MTQFKFKICVILLAFSLALTIGSVVILRGNRDQQNEQGSTANSDSLQDPLQSSATLPTSQLPQQMTTSATEDTAEATTEETT